MATEAVRGRGNQWAQLIGSRLGLTDPADLATLRDAYLVSYEFPAPLMVRVADDMLADLRADVGSRRTDRILGLGRDGHHLALAMRMLDRDFMKANCSNLVVSRALVENALQDLENHRGLRFPQVDEFRRVASRVDPADTVGGFHVLTEYLQTRGVPVGRPGSRAFAHQLALNSIEELFDGPMSSPVRIGSAGPEQTGQRHHPALLDGLSRGRISPRLKDLPVREGVKVMNLRAVIDFAGDVAEMRDAGGNYRASLDDRAHRYRTEIRAWISGESTDPRLAEFLDSFVHRADKQQACLLQKALDRAQIPETTRESIWAAYEQCGSDGDKKVFVENVLNSTRARGGSDGRREEKRPGGRLDGPLRDDRGL